MPPSSFRAENTVLTGSITEVSSGVPFIIAGSGVTVSVTAQDQFEISATGGGTGDITSVIAGTGLGGGGTTGDVTLTLDPSSNRNVDHTSVFITGNNGITGGGDITTSRTLSLDFSALTDMTGDISGTTEFILQDGTTESRKAASEINLSSLNNDSGWTSNTGTVTSVGITPGNLIDVTGSPITTSGNITVDVDLSELPASSLDSDGSYFAVIDSLNAQRKLSKGSIKISGFNNDFLAITSLQGLKNNTDGTYVYDLGVDNSIVATLTGSEFEGNVGITGSFGVIADSNDDEILLSVGSVSPKKLVIDTNSFKFNSTNEDIDFSVSSSTDNGIIFVDSDIDSVVIGHEGFGTGGKDASLVSGMGQDIKILLSGSSGLKGTTNQGVIAIAGDLSMSGSIYMEDDGSGSDVSRGILFSPDGSLYIKSPSISTYEALDFNSTIVRLGGDLGNTAEPIGNNDVNIFLSGSIGSKNTGVRGTTLVGGDLVVSGSLYGYPVVERGYFQNPEAGGSLSSGVYFPGDDSITENSSPAAFTFHIAESRIEIQSVKLRFQLLNNPSAPATLDLTVSIHEGVEGDASVSTTANTSVTNNINVNTWTTTSNNDFVNKVYDFIFESNNIIEENNIWTLKLSSNTMTTGGTVQFLIKYRRI